MMHIFDCIDSIKSGAQELVNLSEKLERLYLEGDFEKLLSAGEKSLRSVSDLYLLNRELLLSLYELIPSLPRTVDISKVEFDALNISLKRSGSLISLSTKSLCRFCCRTSARETPSSETRSPTRSLPLSEIFAAKTAYGR